MQNVPSPHFQALNIMELRIVFNVPIYFPTSRSSASHPKWIELLLARWNPTSQSESFSSGTMLRLPLSSMTSSGWVLHCCHGSIADICCQGTALSRRATAAMDRRSPVRRFSRRERRRCWMLGRSARSWDNTQPNNSSFHSQTTFS